MGFLRPSIHFSEEFPIGTLVILGDPTKYEPRNYARIISPEDYATKQPLPEPRKFLRQWGDEARRSGFVYVEQYNAGIDDLIYDIIPRLWISEIVDNPQKEIDCIRKAMGRNIEHIRSLYDDAISFLRKEVQ